MLRQVHKVFLTLCILNFLIVINPIFAINNQNNLLQNNESMELVQNDIDVEDLDINPINTTSVKKSVIPDPKEEGKKVLNLFLKTISLSAICAFLIYIILLFVKKFYGSAFVNKEPEEFEKLDLSTPEDKQNALKSFLNRSK